LSKAGRKKRLTARPVIARKNQLPAEAVR